MKPDMSKAEKSKKPYKPPSLVCYGDILKLTQNKTCNLANPSDGAPGCTGTVKHS